MKRAPGMPGGRGQGPGTTSANPGLRCTCPRTPRVGEGTAAPPTDDSWRAPGHVSESCGEQGFCDEAMLAPFPPASPLRVLEVRGAPTPRPRTQRSGPGGRGAPLPGQRSTQGPLLPDPLLPLAGQKPSPGDPGPGRGQDTLAQHPCSRLLQTPGARALLPLRGSGRGTASLPGRAALPPRSTQAGAMPFHTSTHTEKTGRNNEVKWPHSQDVTVPLQARVPRAQPLPAGSARHKHPHAKGHPLHPAAGTRRAPRQEGFPALPSFPFFLRLLSLLPSMQPFLPLIHY